MKRVFLLFFSCLALVPAAVRADYVMTEHGTAAVKKKSLKETKKIVFPTQSNPKKNPEGDAIKKLSVLYDIGEDRLRYFRDLHHGYSDIVPALIIARDAEVEPGRVIKMRDEGQLWPDIAKGFFVDTKRVDQESAQVLKELKKTVPLSAINDLPRRIQ